MGNIIDHVDVQIQLQDRTPTQAGFGVPLIFDAVTWKTGTAADLVRSYSDIDGVGLDIDSNTSAYAMAAAIFSQNPAVPLIKIGRRTRGPKVNYKFQLLIDGKILGAAGGAVLADLEDGKNYGFSFNGTDVVVAFNAVTHTSIDLFFDAFETILTPLIVAIQATGTLAQVAGEFDATITFPDVAPIIQYFAPVIDTTTTKTVTWNFLSLVQNPATDTTAAEDLADIRLIDDAWYGILSPNINNKETRDLGLAIEAISSTARKLFIATTDSPNVLAGTADDVITSGTYNVTYDLNRREIHRTGIIYRPPILDGSFQYPCGAWMGTIFPENPGSVTWKFKSLAGISAQEYTTTDKNNLILYKGNIYERTAGLGITREGTGASGRFLDLTRGMDWLVARIEERVFFRMANTPKIPYTDAGVAIIRGDIEAVLVEAQEKDVLSIFPVPVVEVPAVATIPSIVKATRVLPDIIFRATVSGAIHKVEIRGIVSV